jgi:hypothetical protein
MMNALCWVSRGVVACGIVLGMVWMVGCDNGAAADGVCDPGATQTCVCPDGVGAQSCTGDGSGWRSCVCGDGASPSDGDAAGSSRAVDGGTVAISDGANGPGPGTDASECAPHCEGEVPYICDSEGEAVAQAPCGVDFYCHQGRCDDCEGVSFQTCEGDLLLAVDACGELGDTVQDCAEVGYCSEGACVTACLPQHERRCVGNDVYWFDSCGSEGGQAEACNAEEFCEGCQPEDANCSKEGHCVKATLSGTWSVSANPSSQSVLGGDVPFLPAMVELQVDGTEVTGHAEVGIYVIDYVGTLTGKNLKMTGNYTESSMLGDVAHVEVYDVHFSDPSTFSGLNSDTFTVPMVGDTTIYWTVTGVKQ